MDPLHSRYLYIHTVNTLVVVGFRSYNSQNMYILFFRKFKPSDIDLTVTVVLTAWIHNILTLGNLDPIKQFAKYVDFDFFLNTVRFISDSLQNAVLFFWRVLFYWWWPYTHF